MKKWKLNRGGGSKSGLEKRGSIFYISKINYNVENVA